MLLVLRLMCLVYPSSIVPPSSARISGSSRVGYTYTLKLTCVASGIVDNYNWYRNNSLLTTTTKRYYKSSAQLSDTGSYQCEACNWAGCSTRSSSHTVAVIGLFMWPFYYVTILSYSSSLRVTVTAGVFTVVLCA